MQDLAVQHGYLKYEVDNLKNKLSLTQKKLNIVIDENEKHKQEMRKLVSCY